MLHVQVKVGNYLLAAAAGQIEEIWSVVAKVYVGGSFSCWDSKLLLMLGLKAAAAGQMRSFCGRSVNSEGRVVTGID
jgi:hypothetical protein